MGPYGGGFVFVLFCRVGVICVTVWPGRDSRATSRRFACRAVDVQGTFSLVRLWWLWSVRGLLVGLLALWFVSWVSEVADSF